MKTIPVELAHSLSDYALKIAEYENALEKVAGNSKLPISKKGYVDISLRQMQKYYIDSINSLIETAIQDGKL